MTSPRDIGVLTTDADLIVRGWDDWLAEATGILADHAKGRPLAELIPGLHERGLLERFRETLTSGMVQVLSPALHRTIFPCAPRVPSPHFQLMQQRVTIGPLLDGERIAGLLVTVQDVTPQLDAERRLAAALVSADPDSRRAAADAIVEAERVESLESFAPALRNDDWRVRRVAVGGLVAVADRDLLHALLETLRREHRNFSTLSSALKLFATTDVDLTAPLAELLHDADVDLRIQAALALGEQHHPAAVEPLLGALEDPDVNVRFHAIEALGRLHADAAVDALVKIAGSGDVFLAFAALEALALIRDPRVASGLTPLLGESVLREAVVRAMSELGDDQVIRPLVATLNSSPESTLVTVGALASVGDRLAREGLDVSSIVRESLSDAGRAHVLAAAAGSPESAMPAVARVLGWSGGDESIAALGVLLTHAGAREAAIDALVRQGEQAVDALVARLPDDDQDVVSAAISALGQLGSRRATSALVALLDDPTAVVAACGGLARIGDPAAFEPLLGLLGQPDASVRLAAIGALNSIGHTEMPARILEMLGHDDPLMRESAVRIAGYFGYPAALDAVLSLAGDGDEMVRSAALEHLPFFDEDRALPVLAAAMASGTPKVRAAAVRALVRVDAPEASVLLSNTLADGEHWVRYFAAKGLGERPVAAPLTALLRLAEGDPSTPVRIAAIEALGASADPEPVATLKRCAADDNVDVAAAAIFAIGRVGGAEALEELRRAAHADQARIRGAAVKGLTALGSSDAVRELEWLAAGDPDAQVGGRAIAALGDIAARTGDGADAAITALVALLADPDRSESAISAIIRLPVDRLPQVASGLAHPQLGVRRRTVDALARYRRPEATRLLRPAFSDDDPRVRETAALAVMRIGTRSFDDTLRELAHTDGSKAVRRAAADALAGVRNAN